MQRWSTAAVGALFVGVVGAAIWKAGSGTGKTAPSVVAEPSASAKNGAAPAASGAAANGADPSSIEALLDNGAPAAPFPGSDAAAPLPAGAPKVVRFGVTLVQYKGAQGASANARSKDEALQLARTLADTAKTDFKAAVQRGDPGSTEDAGRMPRGILEPAIEYELFTLSAGAVSGPLDTPRGFWIVRRID